MNAPVVVDIDLQDRRPQIPAYRPRLRAVVWWGDRLLGEAVLAEGRTWAAARTDLFDQFGEQLTALRSVSAAPAAPHLVTPGEVTVVVCSRERPEFLHACLQAVGDLDPVPAEVIVVDNAPTTTATAEVTERFGVRRIVEPRPGLSHARNAGWRAAGTRVVAYTDDDARPHARWIGALCEGFVASEVGCVTGLIVAGELATPAQRRFESNGGMGKGYLPRLFSAQGVGVQGFHLGAGANMAFARSALEQLGGFDVRLGPGRPTRGGDDLDAFVRLLDAGWVAAYQPDAVVRHLHRRDILSLSRQYRDNGTGYSALLRKYEVGAGRLGAAAATERTRWRIQRHIGSLATAVRRRDEGRLLEILSEIAGSRHGARAFDAERSTDGGPDA